MSTPIHAIESFEARYLSISTNEISYTDAYSATINLDRGRTGELIGIELLSRPSNADSAELISRLRLPHQVSLELKTLVLEVN